MIRNEQRTSASLASTPPATSEMSACHSLARPAAVEVILAAVLKPCPHQRIHDEKRAATTTKERKAKGCVVTTVITQCAHTQTRLLGCGVRG